MGRQRGLEVRLVFASMASRARRHDSPPQAGGRVERGSGGYGRRFRACLGSSAMKLAVASSTSAMRVSVRREDDITPLHQNGRFGPRLDPELLYRAFAGASFPAGAASSVFPSGSTSLVSRARTRPCGRPPTTGWRASQSSMRSTPARGHADAQPKAGRPPALRRPRHAPPDTCRIPARSPGKQSRTSPPTGDGVGAVTVRRSSRTRRCDGVRERRSPSPPADMSFGTPSDARWARVGQLRKPPRRIQAQPDGPGRPTVAVRRRLTCTTSSASTRKPARAHA